MLCFWTSAKVCLVRITLICKHSTITKRSEVLLFFSNFVICLDLCSLNGEMSEKPFAEVESFDTHKLKHVETQEKNPLPTSDGEIWNIA